MKAITKRLRVLRAEKGLNQTKVAQRARMSRDRYLRIELGYTEPSDTELARLARVFGVAEVLSSPEGELVSR